ncbi:cytochrome c oxidase assembly protein [Metabacillus idriensis]|uniref:cytochrome c oxidase assembly protein n=1 Tax=Metabacillus idriensis TaxID=324768 RepID=UPI00398FA648
MSMHHSHHAIGIGSQLLLALPFVIALILYCLAVFLSNRSRKQWPFYRTVFWIIGVLLSLLSVIGPLANRAHMDFTAHMLGHLLLGMLAPMLMVLAAPMTLALRTLKVKQARWLIRVLKTLPVRVLSGPIVAALLNVGGLWLLYTTDLYASMHQNALLHIVLHFHVFIAGYLFTVSMIYIDPAPHRTSFVYRSIVLVLALGGHGILSKYIYAHPPSGVSAEQAEAGGMLMYYGGDAIDIMIIYILCLQWYRAARPRIRELSLT